MLAPPPRLAGDQRVRVRSTRVARTRIAGRFEVEDDPRRARGASGVIERALDLDTGRHVAIKILTAKNPGVASRFVAEQEMLAKLSHPGIVEHVAHGTTAEGRLYMAMEWLEGEDLASRLARGPLSVDDTLALAQRIASALGEVHRHDFIHRDVKPANIFLPGRRASAAKLLDFGAARGAVRLTSENAFVGTVGYLAPEQARGDKNLTPAVDVFSLGIVLFECFTGFSAYSGTNAIALLAKVALEPPPRLREERPDLPEVLDLFLAQMMAMSPSDRFENGTAAELALLDLWGPTGARSASTERSLGRGERALSSVVMAGAGDSQRTESGERDTVLNLRVELTPSVEATIAGLGGRSEHLRDGALLVSVPSSARADADERAISAARIALSLRAALPDAPIALATAMSEIAVASTNEELIDRAAALLETVRTRRRGGVGVDALTADLLGPRFEVEEVAGVEGGVEGGLELHGERTRRGQTTSIAWLSGRADELATLDEAWDAVSRDRAARAVLLTGPPGIGKSRLVVELVARTALRAPGVRAWVAHGNPLLGHPFELLAQLVRHATGIRPADDAPKRRAKIEKRLVARVASEDAPRVLTSLVALVGAPPVEEDPDGPARDTRPDGVPDEAIREGFEDWLRAEAATGPLLIVVDDAHLSDPPSLGVLLTLARPTTALPLLVLAVGRNGLSGSERESTQVIKLTGLSREASKELAIALVDPERGASVDESVDEIVELANGNPLFLEQLARAASKGETALPAMLVAMAQARVTELDPEARRVLRAASVFGRTFLPAAVAALLGAGLEDGLEDASEEDGGALVVRWLPALVAEGLLVRSEDADPAYAFVTELLRDAAYEMLTNRDLLLGHELAARWLAERSDTDAVVLAEHWGRSGDVARAATALRDAAAQALEGDDLDRVIELTGRAIEAGAEGVLLGELSLIEADARGWRGDVEGSATSARRAMAHLTLGSERWFAAVGATVRADAIRADSEGSIAMTESLVAFDPAPHQRIPLVIALSQSAESVLSVGAYALAGRVEEKILAIEASLRSVEPYVAAWIHSARASFAHHRGDTVELKDELAEAASAMSTVGDLRGEARQRINLANAYIDLGCVADAERELNAAIEIAEDLRLARLAAGARQNLAVVSMRRGDLDRAVELLRDAEHRFASIGDRRLLGGTRLSLAEAHRAMGRFDEAIAFASDAARMLEGAPPNRAGALAELSMAMLDAGRREEALRVANEAFALFESLGQLESREELVMLARAKALHACGEAKESRAAVRHAIARLEERAAKIRDPLWRERFLHGNPDRTELLGLKAELERR